MVFAEVVLYITLENSNISKNLNKFLGLLDFWSTSGLVVLSEVLPEAPEVVEKCSRSPEVQKPQKFVEFFADEDSVFVVDKEYQNHDVLTFDEITRSRI